VHSAIAATVPNSSFLIAGDSLLSRRETGSDRSHPIDYHEILRKVNKKSGPLLGKGVHQLAIAIRHYRGLCASQATPAAAVPLLPVLEAQRPKLAIRGGDVPVGPGLDRPTPSRRTEARKRRPRAWPSNPTRTARLHRLRRLWQNDPRTPCARLEEATSFPLNRLGLDVGLRWWGD
jgi:hypothetical protein